MELKYCGSWNFHFNYFSIAFLLALLFIRFQKRKVKSLGPPGPARYPLFGNLPNVFLHRKYPNIPHVLADIAEKWGDIMSLKISNNDTVIFSDYKTAFAILNHENAQDRAMSTVIMERLGYKNLGINFSNGSNWQQMKTFTMSCLKCHGFNNFSEQMLEEVQCLTKHWDLNSLNKKSGMLVNTQLFEGAVFNILWKLLSGGDRFDYKDERLKLVLHSTEQFTRNSNLVVDPLAFFPWLRHILCNTLVARKWFKNIKQFCMEELQKHKDKMKHDKPTSFLDKFAKKILENSDSSTIFTDEQFVVTLMDLFQNAVDTISSALVYVFMYSILYPAAKNKMLKEIDEFMTAKLNRTASPATQSTLPYTFAFILETLRFSSSIPIVAPRVATAGINIGGYHIEAGTSLLTNLLALNTSKSVWGDPENFRPERFLSSCGKLNKDKTRLVMSFGSGRRVCPSQKFSEQMILIFVVEILSKYEFLPCSETLPVSDQHFAVSYYPKPFRATVRNRVVTNEKIMK